MNKPILNAVGATWMGDSEVIMFVNVHDEDDAANCHVYGVRVVYGTPGYTILIMDMALKAGWQHVNDLSKGYNEIYAIDLDVKDDIMAGETRGFMNLGCQIIDVAIKTGFINFEE